LARRNGLARRKGKCLPPQERRLGRQQKSGGQSSGQRRRRGNTKPLILHRASFENPKLHSVRISASKQTNHIERDAVFDALKEAVRQAQQTVTEKHTKATRSAHRDALYKHVLLGCALAATHSRDALGYFNPGSVAGPLSNILNRTVPIAAFSHHLSEFCSVKRAEVLERTGQQRNYRFRFRDPLLVPYVLMDAMNTELISRTDLADMLGQEF